MHMPFPLPAPQTCSFLTSCTSQMFKPGSQVNCDLSCSLSCPNSCLFPSLCKVFLAPPERPSCVQVSPLYGSLRSIVLIFLSNLSCLSPVHSWSKFLWPSSFDLSYSPALYCSAQMLFSPQPLFSPLQETALNVWSSVYFSGCSHEMHYYFSKFLFNFFLTKYFVEILGINKENDKIKNNVWSSASHHDAEQQGQLYISPKTTKRNGENIWNSSL